MNNIDKNVRLDGKVVLITGANSGIGYETTKDLAARGARLVMACRDLESAQQGKENIIKEFPEADICVSKLDLSSLKSVQEFAENFLKNEDKLNILINNAGVMYCPQGKTEDGFETHFGVNHMGHFLLTNLLLDLIKKSAPSRIVVVSSSGYKRGTMKWDDLMNEKDYQPFPVYFDSKLANTLFAQELSRRLDGTGVTCNALHPGMVKSNLGRHMRGPHVPLYRRAVMSVTFPIALALFKTPARGAQASIHCAVSPQLEGVTGKYFRSDCAEEEVLPKASNAENGKKLWQISEELCQRALEKDADKEQDSAPVL